MTDIMKGMLPLPKLLAFKHAFTKPFTTNGFAIPLPTSTGSIAIRIPLVLPLALLFLIVLCSIPATKPYMRFAYNCFIKPHAKDVEGGVMIGQQASLEGFYKGQADVYDLTRGRLLRGRETMLRLVSGEVLAKRVASHTSEKKVWIDIGGGTGWNIEQMAKHLPMPITQFFDKIYLVDFSPSLCSIARKRFDSLGFTNVEVVCADAAQWTDASVPDGSVDLITFSYSLSMIPPYLSVIEKANRLLSADGLIALADFYTGTSSSLPYTHPSRSTPGHHVSWLARTFWRLWFEADNVHLEPGRRAYLEHVFGTVKVLNGRNRGLGGIPYWVWVGCKRERGYGNIGRVDEIATESPYLRPKGLVEHDPSSTTAIVHTKAYDAAIVNLSAGLPLPSFYYQSHLWRIPYEQEKEKHTQFDTYIYAFTWEDPREDLNVLKVREDDVIVCITSGGDNALAYALGAKKPKRIHCVDLNPCQNHLVELKLAAFTVCGYEEFWRLFGEGWHGDFRGLLLKRLAPHLSAPALEFWVRNAGSFAKLGGLYDSGHSGVAIKAARWLFRIFGLGGAVREMCQTKTLEEQGRVWKERIRPVLLSGWVNKVLYANPVFLWKALGVPINQWKMILAEQTMFEYVANTFDPVIESTLLRDDNYFYLLCLTGRFTKECHPHYLDEESHEKLSQPGALDMFRLHTDFIGDVLGTLTPGTVTKAVLMDHADWFEERGDRSEIRGELSVLRRAMKVGGEVLFRSAAMQPWYVEEYERAGFRCRPVEVRSKGRCIDRTNMYASTWLAVLEDKEENAIPSLRLEVGMCEDR
ncbi:hypothetical protein YB2330_001087 [Saitoella coloradoensis]